MNNSAPHNVSDPPDFTLLEGGNTHGGDILFDKEGYSYIIKRRNMGFNNSKFNTSLKFLLLHDISAVRSPST